MTPKKDSPGRREGRAYLRLAESLRRDIASGLYAPGQRIPPESALCKTSGLALLTVRQALGVLVEEGLLARFPGRGTFVRTLAWREAPFAMGGLLGRVGDDESKARLVRAEMRPATAEVAAKLRVAPGTPLAYLKRAIAAGGGAPFLVQEGHLIWDPRRPLSEAEQDAAYISDLLAPGGQGLVKSARLNAEAVALTAEDAGLLAVAPGTPTFRLDYVLYDAEARPLVAAGAIAAPGALTFTATAGLPLPPEPPQGA